MQRNLFEVQLNDEGEKILVPIEGEPTIDNALDVTSDRPVSNKAIAEAFENRNNYSTEEQVIGKWIDGKPLYRKVVQGIASFTNGAWTSITVDTNTDYKSLVSYNMLVLAGALRLGTQRFTNALNFSTVTTQGNGSTINQSAYTLIIEYTKESD